MISTILLAAGESKRMGIIKQILKFGKNTLLEYTINNLVNSKIDEIVLVLGYKAEEIKKEVSTEYDKLVITINPDFKDGMSSSIKQGIRSINPEAEAALIVLGDQPLISCEIINLVIDSYNEKDIGIVAPVFKGTIGHPVCFNLDKYRDRLLGLSGDKGAKEIVDANKNDFFGLEVSSDNILVDIDDEENYLKALKRIN
jgi:molybdenum cofactor cytidylyltransferase